MKKGILFVLTAAFLASCQQEENEGVASVDRVTITPIITRATEVNFEALPIVVLHPANKCLLPMPTRRRR